MHEDPNADLVKKMLLSNFKGLTKLGNIVAETLFLVMFSGWLN